MGNKRQIDDQTNTFIKNLKDSFSRTSRYSYKGRVNHPWNHKSPQMACQMLKG